VTPAEPAPAEIAQLLVGIVLPQRRVLRGDLAHRRAAVFDGIVVERNRRRDADALIALALERELDPALQRRAAKDYRLDQLGLIGQLVVDDIALVRNGIGRHAPLDRLNDDAEASAGIAAQMLAHGEAR